MQVGRLWTSLSDFYIRRGMFEKARDVYEEGLTSVITVHDFSLIFDAYTQVWGRKVVCGECVRSRGGSRDGGGKGKEVS